MHCLRVRIEHWHSYAGCIHTNGVVTKDLLGLPGHFHLFLGIAIVQEYVNLRQHVEGDLLRIHLAGGRSAIEQVRGLFRELFNGQFAGAGNRLIGRDVDALDANLVVYRFQRHQHLYGGAIRIGDDVAIGIVGNPLWIDLWNHQRNIVFVAEMRGVVDHDTPCTPCLLCIGSRNTAAGREQADLRLGEIEFRKILHRDGFAAEHHLRSG